MVSIGSIVVLLVIFMVSNVKCQTGTNCGSGADTIQLTKFALSPHPIKVPSGSAIQVANFDLTVQLNENIVHPLKTDIKLYKRFLGFWVQAPCGDGTIPCGYSEWTDVCTDCPYPLPAGELTMRMPLNIASSVPTGDYRATFTFTSATNQKGCVEMNGIRLN